MPCSVQLKLPLCDVPVISLIPLKRALCDPPPPPPPPPPTDDLPDNPRTDARHHHRTDWDGEKTHHASSVVVFGVDSPKAAPIEALLCLTWRLAPLIGPLVLPPLILPHQVDLSRYTIDTYMRIVTYKTAFYSFYLPVRCGMIMAGIKDDEATKVAKDILIEMGQYFQVR